MTVAMIDAVPLDAALLDIAPEDLDELARYSPGVPPQDLLAESIRRSTMAYTAVDEAGGFLAIFGYSLDMLGTYPWVVCGRGARSRAKTLVRTARQFLSTLRRWGAVSNVTPEKSPRQRRFLERLGFQFLPAPAGLSHFALP